MFETFNLKKTAKIKKNVHHDFRISIQKTCMPFL